MKATEEEGELLIRGLVLARGHYTPNEIREFNTDELMFAYHYQNLAEDRFFDRLSYLLGVYYNVDDLKAMTKGDKAGKQSGRLFFPLTSVIRPELMDQLRQQYSSSTIIGQGDYSVGPGEKIVSMGELSKEDFLKLIGRPSPASRNVSKTPPKAPPKRSP